MFDLTATLFPDSAPCKLRPGAYAPLPQSALYGRAAATVGARVGYLTLPGTGALVVHRKMPIFGEVALISRGPPALSIPAARTLRTATQSSHVIVNAEDDLAAEALATAGFWRIGRPRQIAELPIVPSPDAMAARLTGKWRNRLRHALRQGLRVSRNPMPPDARHWLFSAEALSARSLGYQPMPPVMVAALAAAKPGAAQLFLARKGGATVAAMLFLRHGRVATYQIGWSTKVGRSTSASNLLMWRAMVELPALGVEQLDLGSADPALAPGLAHFKCGTGAVLRHLGGTWMSSAALPARRRAALRMD